MAITPIAPFISCVCSSAEFEAAKAEGYKEIYILTSKGILKHHQLRGENRYIRLKVESIPGYTEPKIDQEMNFLPAGKIPYNLFEQIEAFFRKVIQVRGTALEAMIFILWNQEQGYHLYVPEQSVAAASVRFDPTTLPGGSTVVVNVHSHGTMSAFFSGTDDNNDKDLVQFSGVFGNFQNPVPSTVWRFNYYATKFKADVGDIFEAPVKQAIEVPQDWMDKVSVTSYQGGYKGGQSYPGNAVRGTAQTGNGGRTYDHLKPYQFKPKDASTTTTKTSNQAGKNDASNDERNTLDAKDRVFNDFGHEGEDYQMGFSVPPGSKPIPTFPAPSVPGAVWRWDPSREGYRNVAGTPEANAPDVIRVGAEDEINESADEAFARALGGTANFDSRFAALNEDPDYDRHFGGEAGSSHLGKSQAQDANPAWQSLQERYENGEAESEESPTEKSDLEYQYEAIAARFGADVADAWWSIDNEMAELHEHPLLLQGLMEDMFNLLDGKSQEDFFRSMFDMMSSDVQAKFQSEGL